MSQRRKVLIGMLSIVILGVLIVGGIVGYRSFADVTLTPNYTGSSASVLFCSVTESIQLCNPELGIYSGYDQAPIPSFAIEPQPSNSGGLNEVPQSPSPSESANIVSTPIATPESTAKPSPSPEASSITIIANNQVSSTRSSPITTDADVSRASSSPIISPKTRSKSSPRPLAIASSDPSVDTSNSSAAIERSPESATESPAFEQAGQGLDQQLATATSLSPTASGATLGQNTGILNWILIGLLISLVGAATYLLWRNYREREQP